MHVIVSSAKIPGRFRNRFTSVFRSYPVWANTLSMMKPDEEQSYHGWWLWQHNEYQFLLSEMEEAGIVVYGRSAWTQHLFFHQRRRRRYVPCS